MAPLISKTNYKSPVGNLTIACDSNENIVGLWIEGQKYFCSTVAAPMIENDNLDIFKRTKKWLDRYFNGEKPQISELPLSPKGSEFRQCVWKILCEIPYGETCTYKEIADIIAKEQGYLDNLMDFKTDNQNTKLQFKEIRKMVEEHFRI